MLLEKLVLKKQVCDGDYNFHVEPVYTKGFSEMFGKMSSELVAAALELINNTYENPDYLQVLYYGNKRFWVVADFKKDAKIEDYEDIERLYVTFMLPEEY